MWEREFTRREGLAIQPIRKNFQDENVRKLILNAILWSAKAEAPKEGVISSAK